MRRFLLPAGLLLLTACSKVPALPTEQVMEKAVLAAQELQSAAFSAHVNLKQEARGRTMTADAALDGRTQDGGKELAMAIDIDMTTVTGDESTSLGLKGDLVALEAGRTFLQIRSVEGDDPAFMNPMLAGLLNQWWALPAAGSGSASTPDPRLLRLQTEALRVTEDHGIETMNGRDAYHYDVGIDRERLVAFFQEIARQRGEQPETEAWTAMLDANDIEGEAWIDAGTFDVLRLRWTVTSKEGAPEAMRLEIDVSFSDHNAAEPITPPAGAKPFPSDLQQLLQLSQGAGLQLPPSATGQELSPEVQEEIIRSLLESR